jgi:hypothetical protein
MQPGRPTRNALDFGKCWKDNTRFAGYVVPTTTDRPFVLAHNFRMTAGIKQLVENMLVWDFQLIQHGLEALRVDQVGPIVAQSVSV